PVGVTLGLQNAQVSAGAAAQLNFFATGGDLAVGAQVVGTGGLVKSGFSGLVLTNATNSYTGGTTINGGSLTIDSFGAVNAFAGGLTIGGGFLKYRGPDAILPGTVVLGGGSATNPGMGGGLSVASGTNLTALSATFSGFGGINKDG